MDDCIFCQIVGGVLPSTEVDRTDTTYAFRDINPAAPVHVLVVPAAHITSVHTVDASHTSVLSDVFAAIRRVADREGIAESGYRVVANVGRDAGQTVDHLHFHVLGGRGMRWPPE